MGGVMQDSRCHAPPAEASGGPAYTNLMFFANIPGVTQTTLTTEQAAAMRGYLTIIDHQ